LGEGINRFGYEFINAFQHFLAPAGVLALVDGPLPISDLIGGGILVVGVVVAVVWAGYQLSSANQGERQYKKTKQKGRGTKQSGKEGATDIPSWARGYRPYVDENSKEFAKRATDDKYGVGYESEARKRDEKQLQKYGDRHFEKGEKMKTFYFETFTYTEAVYVCLSYMDNADMDTADGLYTENNRLVYFESLKKAQQFCSERGKHYIAEPTIYDMVWIQKWVIEGNGENVDCRVLLDFWNIVSDLALALKMDFIGEDEKYNHTYDKLFHGNNLPMINTSGREYVPIWSEEEVLQLKQVIGRGVIMFAQCFEDQGNSINFS